MNCYFFYLVHLFLFTQSSGFHTKYVYCDVMGIGSEWEKESGVWVPVGFITFPWEINESSLLPPIMGWIADWLVPIALVGKQAVTEKNGNLLLENLLPCQWIEWDTIAQLCGECKSYWHGKWNQQNSNSSLLSSAMG